MLTQEKRKKRENMSLSPNVNLQMGPKRYRTKRKFGELQTALDLDEIFPEKLDQSKKMPKVRKTDPNYYRVNPEYVSVNQNNSISRKPRSSMDYYEPMTNEDGMIVKSEKKGIRKTPDFE